MRSTPASGARAAVLAAILFTPAGAAADPPRTSPGEEDVSADDCEAARRCHAGPVTRSGCYRQDERCRVYRERHPEAPPPPTE